ASSSTTSRAACAGSPRSRRRSPSRAAGPRRRRRTMRSRSFLTGFLLAIGSAAAALVFRRRAARRRERAELSLAAGTLVSLASGLPFVIVRKEAKDYGTSKRLEGAFEEGDLTCLVEDVVTSAGAALDAVEALREAGLEVRNAVCVVDRDEGGADALARAGVR